MRSRHTFCSIALASLVLLALLAAPGFAQAGGGGGGGGGGGFGGMGGLTPDQQQAFMDQMTQMQTVVQQIQQNIQNAGADPQAIFQDIAQQAQNGNIDLDAVQRDFIAKGYMTQQMADQLRGTMNQMAGTYRSASLNTIRLQLAASDEEWAVLLPKIQRVLAALQDAARPATTGRTGLGGMGGLGGLGGVAIAQPTPSEISKAFQDLQNVLQDPNTPEDLIAIKLRAWRALHQKARAELAAAQDDLVSILTLRQEAILMNLGML